MSAATCRKHKNLLTFVNTFCFLDYLCAEIDSSEFKKKFKRNLPARISIKNISNLKSSFPNLDINGKHRELQNEVYHKGEKYFPPLFECHIEVAIHLPEFFYA